MDNKGYTKLLAHIRDNHVRWLEHDKLVQTHELRDIIKAVQNGNLVLAETQIFISGSGEEYVYDKGEVIYYRGKVPNQR